MATNWPKRQRNPKLRNQARRAIPRCCAICGSTQALELDHVVPLAEGGADAVDNAQYLCRPHHSLKTDAERRRGVARAVAQRGSLSRKYRDLEPHPGKLD